MAIIRNLQNKAKGQTGASVRRRARRVRSTIEAPAESVSEGGDEHGPEHVMDAVLAMDSKPEVIRGGSEYIHASSLGGLCARREILAAINPTETSVSPRPADRIVWALGRAAESHVRTQFIEAKKAEGIIGEWSCACGHTKTEGAFNKSIECPRCGTKTTRYGELTLFDHDCKIVGNPDLLYVRPDVPKIRVVEIKSMAKAHFDKLTTPKPDHVLQAATYHRLLEVNEMPVDPEGVTILYVCKDYAIGKPYKEYHVDMTQEFRNVIDELWGRAAEIRDWKMARSAGAEIPLPERLGACSSSAAPFAKNCNQCVACFAR